MAVSQRPTPSVPSAKPVSSQSAEEFNSLKQSLTGASWEMAPNTWDAIQLAYVSRGKEEQARSFCKAIDRPQQEIL